jgi:achilleol B synthase
MQYAKQNHAVENIPPVKLEKGAKETEEILLTSLKRAMNQYSALQAHDGHWPGDYSGILIIMPIFVSIFQLRILISYHHATATSVARSYFPNF